MCTIHFDDSGQDGEERATQVDDALVDDQNVDFLKQHHISYMVSRIYEWVARQPSG